MSGILDAFIKKSLSSFAVVASMTRCSHADINSSHYFSNFVIFYINIYILVNSYAIQCQLQCNLFNKRSIYNNNNKFYFYSANSVKSISALQVIIITGIN